MIAMDAININPNWAGLSDDAWERVAESARTF